MSEKPKWQRARILDEAANGRCAGRYVWVEAGPSFADFERGANERGNGTVRRPVLSHCLGDDGKYRVRWSLDHVELLPEFATDVELVPFAQWLAESAPEKEKPCELCGNRHDGPIVCSMNDDMKKGVLLGLALCEVFPDANARRMAFATLHALWELGAEEPTEQLIDELATIVTANVRPGERRQ